MIMYIRSHRCVVPNDGWKESVKILYMYILTVPNQSDMAKCIYASSPRIEI